MPSSAHTPSFLRVTRKSSTETTANDGAPEVDPTTAPAGEADATTIESPRGRSLRHAHRAVLQGYALLSAALFAVVIVLAASNTARAKVSWIVGTSHVSLVWMVLAAALIGWLMGLATALWLHRRTRAPR
jgi:uncharacterized integral membrane protein